MKGFIVDYLFRYIFVFIFVLLAGFLIKSIDMTAIKAAGIVTGLILYDLLTYAYRTFLKKENK